MVEFPKKPGPYRMYTESGNAYLAIINYRFYSDGQACVHVFQPKTFRCETYTGHGEKDVCRKFAPTEFVPIYLYEGLEQEECEPCTDLQYEYEPETADA